LRGLARRSHFRSTLTLVALLPLACSPAETGEPSGASDMSDDLAGREMLAYLEAKIDIADDKFMQMAEAIPEELYDYRPMEGTRSFRDVFIHIAADNWFGGALMDIPTPDDIGIDKTQESVNAYQEQRLSKEETLVHLRRSFDYFHAAIDETRDHLATPAMLRTLETNYGDLWVRLVTHMHEHLGQTIAYARTNEIVPPWSR